MKRVITFLLLVAIIIIPAKAAEQENVKQVKNIIVMIPDGTALPAVSFARWLQWYQNPDKPNLNIDPYLCGTVRTFCSNAPIGDSAPTTSCYMTGYPSRAGYVATYPPTDGEDDIYPVDPERAYQPMTTVLEASKILLGKSTGLVFTCEFPHATPADCSAHSYNRGKYDWIAPQMVHNNINVVIGGGASYLDETCEQYLLENGYSVYKNDISGFRTDTNEKMWALFQDKEMSYDIDRDSTEEPSIEEMTRKAIEKLSKNENGFFLMVEGSKVDWAAHANDPVGMATDFLAFDRACGAALEFAKQDGETAVIILPDHETGGLSLGSYNCSNYSSRSKEELFGKFAGYKRTAEGLARLVNSRPNSEIQNIFKTYTGKELTDDELNALYNCKDYKNSPIPKDKRSGDGIGSLYSSSLTGFMSKLIRNNTCVNFTTGGHTGGDVFLAVYHPQGTRLTGMHDNIEINHYLCELFGLSGKLDELTRQNFAKHTDVFKDFTYEILPAEEKNALPTLVVKNPKNKKKQLTITPNTNIVKAGKKGKEEIRLLSVIVYVDKNNTFYLPQQLADYLK